MLNREIKRDIKVELLKKFILLDEEQDQFSLLERVIIGELLTDELFPRVLACLQTTISPKENLTKFSNVIATIIDEERFSVLSCHDELDYKNLLSFFDADVLLRRFQ